MQCKISCSFGEIVDKITILRIKSKKITNIQALKNINLELKTIQDENPLTNTKDNLFDKLHKINLKLWILEDIIREKSINKIFDDTYIQIAESIHKTNDERCNIKKLINIKYNSELIEEKSYYKNEINIDNEDIKNLDKGKRLYTNGDYEESYKILNRLMKKYKNNNIYDNFFVDLIFAYDIIISIFNYSNEHKNKIEHIIKNLETLDILFELKEYCKKMYATYCLSNKYYTNNYLNIINYVIGPNINYNNMSFFKENDKNKTLLIYDGGGIGDKFMFSRFIPELCQKYKENKIIFFIDDNIAWFFNDCFKNIENYRCVSYSQPILIGNFDYHCSLLSLMKYLKIDYNDITFSPLLKNINYKYEEKHKKIIENIKNNKNKTFIFNWKGNSQNLHEKYNRRMDLINAIPLFQLPNINWIVITKDITHSENKILKKYKISNYGNILDNGNNCFEDSISIINNVDGVISTDTSLVHLSANLNVKTFVLLTLGCEWRWTRNDKNTNWYPNSILIRQNKFNDWSNVIDELINKLYN